MKKPVAPLKKPLPKRNVADSIESSAQRIAASLKPRQESQVWDQDRLAKLIACDGKVGAIPVGLIKTNANIRHRIDEQAPAQLELVESIRRHGILQAPIVTVVTSESGEHSVLLVGGERRLRAAIALGHDSINCLVKIFSGKDTQLTASMAENLNRKDLDPLDVAECFCALADQGYKYQQLHQLFGRDEKTIGRYIKIARWPKDVHALVRQHHDGLTIKFLFTLASRTLSPEQLREAILAKVAKPGAPGVKPAASAAKVKEQQQLMPRLTKYLDQKGLSTKERALVLRVFYDLKLLDDGAARSVAGATAKPAVVPPLASGHSAKLAVPARGLKRDTVSR